MKPKTFSILFAILMLLLSACQRNITRNGDGTASIETTVSQQELQDAINASLADPLITELTVSLQSGYALVSGQRQRVNDAGKTDTLSFRIELGVSNTQLTATISSALLDNKPIEQNRINNWNQTLANRIANLGNKRPNSSLQSVNITPEVVTMTWRVSQ